MFAKKASSPEEDFYFQRVQTSIGQGQKCSFLSKVERASPQLSHQADLPNPARYDPDAHFRIGTEKHKTETWGFRKARGRFEGTSTKKEQLLLGSMMRDFKQFMPQNLDLLRLEEDKRREEAEEKCSPSKLALGKPEFFMAKESRFREAKPKPKSEVASPAYSPAPADPNPKKKEPFALGENRFH